MINKNQFAGEKKAETIDVLNDINARLPLLTDIFSTRLEDTFLDDSLKFSVTLMRDVKKSGMTVFSKAGWDFHCHPDKKIGKCR